MRGFWNLFKKEVTALLPAIALGLFLGTIDLVYTPFASRLDEVTWSSINSSLRPGHGFEFGVIYMVFAFIVGFSLFPREHDEGTIDYLYSLPVSRSAIFFAKFFAGLLALFCLVGSHHIVTALLHSMNPNSFARQHFSWDIFLKLNLVHFLFSAIILTHSLTLSFFRRFGLIIYAFLILAVILLKNVDPSFDIADPTLILNAQYHSRELVIAWRPLACHLAVGAVSLAVGYGLWLDVAERFFPTASSTLETPTAKVIMGCGTFTLILLGLVLLIVLAMFDKSQGSKQDVSYHIFQPVRAKTKYFDITYPASLSAKAKPLIRQADDIYLSLTKSLGMTVKEFEEGGQIVVDMLDQSVTHAGIAQWKRMRLNIAGEDSLAQLTQTFAHEMTHTLQFRLAEKRFNDNFVSVQFYAEGMAEYCSFERVENKTQRRRSRQLAALSCKRFRIRFEDLVDREAFRARHNPHLIYPIGETWVAALVQCYGSEAPAKLLRSLGREGAPKELEGRALWQDLCQHSGFDLERVLTAWKALLEMYQTLGTGEQAALPRIHGGLLRREAESYIFRARVEHKPPEGVRYILRMRDHERVEDDGFKSEIGEIISVDEAVVVDFKLPKQKVFGQSFDVQFGVSIKGRHVLPYYEDWQRVQSR